MTTTLFTTKDELYAVQQALQKAKSSTRFVKVPKDALDHLQRDHSRLFSLCKSQVIEPEAQR